MSDQAPAIKAKLDDSTEAWFATNEDFLCYVAVLAPNYQTYARFHKQVTGTYSSAQNWRDITTTEGKRQFVELAKTVPCSNGVTLFDYLVARGKLKGIPQ